MGKRRKFNNNDNVVKSLLAALEDADKTERISGRSSSAKTSKYSADNMQRRNLRRYRELNLIQHRLNTELAPEHALMDLISNEGLIPYMQNHMTRSSRSRRRNELYEIGDELLDRRSELEAEINNDDDIFDEVTSSYRP